MTNTTKLALCSNEYYETEYDENGIIIVKDWGNSPKIKCSPEETENSPSGGSVCAFKMNTLDNLIGLKCLQKLVLPWSTTVEYVTEKDIPILLEFKNLEDFTNGDCYSNLFITLSKLKNLKHISTDCSIYSKDANLLATLPKLETLQIRTYNGTLDFNYIPRSIRKLDLYEFNGFVDNIKNINNISNLVYLESFSWDGVCQYNDKKPQKFECPEELKQIFLQIIKLSPSIKEINSVKVDKNNFQWDSFIKQMEQGS
jgi:hypothetical protein